MKTGASYSISVDAAWLFRPGRMYCWFQRPADPPGIISSRKVVACDKIEFWLVYYNFPKSILLKKKQKWQKGLKRPEMLYGDSQHNIWNKLWCRDRHTTRSITFPELHVFPERRDFSSLRSGKSRKLRFLVMLRYTNTLRNIYRLINMECTCL